ncbi:MAG: hypothetical protein P8J45_06755 [Phycisphaerales bacterium]|nr:hypothetical protein [Phycisphaerales bacterium]
MNQTPHALILPLLMVATSTAFVAAGDETTTIIKDAPDRDRWMYPFNASPGTRPAASIFGYATAIEAPFDNRDGQFVIGFDTDGDLAPGTANDYQVVSAKVTIQLSNQGIVYDATTDPWQNFVEPDNPDYIEDSDPGQPIELFGTDYRSGFDATTWYEDAPFGFGDTTLMSSRTAFAASYRDGELVDASNHVREGWTPTPFATAVIDGVSDGEVIPLDSVFEFEIDVTDPNIQSYILESLDHGTLTFTVASMTEVEVMGGTFPLFYCRENVAVEFGVASAATLDLVLEPASGGDPCDLTGDGIVDGADLSRLLGSWGTSDPLPDLDSNGTVDGADLAALLGCWS